MFYTIEGRSFLDYFNEVIILFILRIGIDTRG